MAKSATAQIYMPNGERIEFTLDGLAMADQMEKLIKISAELLKTWDVNNKSANESLQELSEEATTTSDKIKGLGKNVTSGTKNISSSLENLEKVFSPIASGQWRLSMEKIPDSITKMSFWIGAAVGSLSGYADTIKDSLQRGVSGNVFDIAIAAKTAGLSVGEFNKALGETGGSFAALGTGATNGAKQFGLLVGEVRGATKSVGNLGMSNDQLAMLTAQQVKVAVAQGFKGRQAQEVVVKNSRMLGEELDNLANRTGKSTLELAQAAAKLAQDPIVANFVRSAKSGSQEVSSAVQTFTASLKGIFGEQGEQIAKDALQSALSGLPMVVTQTGKNMVLAGSGIYNEIERQAQAASRGEKVTEADRARLREMIISETKSRSAELNQFAMLGGAVGESAKQLLAMANEAENYNSSENIKRREQDKTAQEFNAAVRDLQANMQALTIPFLKLLNNIDWGTFISVIGSVIGALNSVLGAVGGFVDKLFQWIPGLENAHGILATVVGGLLGFGAVIVGAMGIWRLLSKTSASLAGDFISMQMSIKKFVAYTQIALEMNKNIHFGNKAKYSKMENLKAAGYMLAGEAAYGYGKLSSGGRLARFGKGLSAAAIAGGVANTAAGAVGEDTTAGKALGVMGTAASWGSMGMMFGPKGALVGAVAGGLFAGFEKFFGNKDEQSAKDELQKEQLSAAEKAEKDYKDTLAQSQQMLQELRAIREESGYSNQISARGVSYQASTERKISNLQFNT
jgi:hypothetical protein